MDSMKDEHPVAALAEALEVSPSGFHTHQRKAQGQRHQEDRALSREIAPIFAASRQTYGCPRVTAALRQEGQRCGQNRVARLMRENQLTPRQKRKRWRPTTTDSNHRQPVAENWLAKVPAPDQPDQVWVADITYIDTGEGWLYLAGLLDACTRRLVGWQTGETLAAELVTQAWQKAVRDRRPGPGLLHHSDRGVQYASAMMESFWATLKTECFAGERPATRQAAKLLIFDYVEGFDNRTRLHSSLGYQSPLAFETNLRYSRN